MLKNGNFILSTYQYHPDLWNLKPPFSYYCISLSYLIFGFSAFSLRIYSVISMILVYWISVAFLCKNSSKLSVLFFGVTFLSFGDFFFGHCGRCGDADSLFLLLYLIAMFALAISTKHHLALCFFGFAGSLAFLTKSFHAVPIFLIGAVYFVLNKAWKIFKVKELVIAALTVVVPILIWATCRYATDKMQFLGIMFGIDVTERISRGVANGGTTLGFIVYMAKYRPTQVLSAVLILCCIMRFFVNGSGFAKPKNYELVLVLWLLVSVLFFSFSRTVETWYYYPTFLCLMLLDAFLLNDIITFLLKEDEKGKKHTAAFSIIVLTAACFLGFGGLNITKNIQKTSCVRETKAQNAIILFSDEYPIFKGYNCYFAKSSSEDLYPPKITEGVWEQCDVLCAELYGDYFCLNGGIDRFLQDNHSVFFIEKSLAEQHASILNSFDRYDVQNYYVFINIGYSKRGTLNFP